MWLRARFQIIYLLECLNWCIYYRQFRLNRITNFLDAFPRLIHFWNYCQHQKIIRKICLRSCLFCFFHDILSSFIVWWYIVKFYGLCLIERIINTWSMSPLGLARMSRMHLTEIARRLMYKWPSKFWKVVINASDIFRCQRTFVFTFLHQNS